MDGHYRGLLRSGQSVHEDQENREDVNLMPGYKLHGGQDMVTTARG